MGVYQNAQNCFIVGGGGNGDVCRGDMNLNGTFLMFREQSPATCIVVINIETYCIEEKVVSFPPLGAAIADFK